jgi:hypothetical protein
VVAALEMPMLVSVPWIDDKMSKGNGHGKPRSDSKRALQTKSEEDKREAVEVKS